MYSNETVKKVVGMIRERISHYESISEEEIKICISGGNRKIGRVLNVSLPPVLTCANCSGCKNYCYDIKACLQYSNTVIDARARNYILAFKFREKYFSEIRKKCTNRRKNKFFRWHVSGDIPDMGYLKEMIAIAREFPDFIFWTYTKNYKLVNAYCKEYGKESIPCNLSIMFSEWKGMQMVNPYNFPEFRCIMPGEEIPEGFTRCPGNCEECTSKKHGCPYRKNKYVFLH